MDNERITELISNRPKGHYSVNSEIGTALENVPTADLVRYFVEVVMNGNDDLLRTYVEEKIIAHEVNKIRYQNDLRYRG